MKGGNQYDILSIDSTPDFDSKSKKSIKSKPIESKLQNRLILSLIIKLLTQGKKVVFEPTYYGADYNSMFFGRLMTLINGNCKNCEFIYTPVFNNPSYKYSSSGFFKTEINMTHPMMFAPSTFLINFLKMFLSIEDLSIYIGNGSYEFMSRVRVGYNIEKKLDAPPVPKNSPVSMSPSKKLKSKSKSTTKGGNKPVSLNTSLINEDIRKYNEMMTLTPKNTNTKSKKTKSKTKIGGKKYKSRRRK